MPTNQRDKARGRKDQSYSQRQSGSATGIAADDEDTEDMRHEVSGYVSRGGSQIREMTRDREGTTVLVALAAGFGVGLLIGGAIAASHHRPRTWSDRIAAEGIGRRLLARVERIIPDALAERIGR